MTLTFQLQARPGSWAQHIVSMRYAFIPRYFKNIASIWSQNIVRALWRRTSLQNKDRQLRFSPQFKRCSCEGHHDWRHMFDKNLLWTVWLMMSKLKTFVALHWVRNVHLCIEILQPTNFYLQMCKLVESSLYDLCNMEIDGIEHIFWNCQQTQILWNELFKWFFDTDIDVFPFKKSYRIFSYSPIH